MTLSKDEPCVSCWGKCPSKPKWEPMEEYKTKEVQEATIDISAMLSKISKIHKALTNILNYQLICNPDGTLDVHILDYKPFLLMAGLLGVKVTEVKNYAGYTKYEFKLSEDITVLCWPKDSESK